MAKPGDVVERRYRLVRPIGSGAMGEVWLAQHTTLTNHVAVKLVSESRLTHERVLSRFTREARIAARIQSPHVVQVLDHGHHEAAPWRYRAVLRGGRGRAPARRAGSECGPLSA
ncbi:MAG: protein kinase, partial [Myxococcota bacterium]